MDREELRTRVAAHPRVTLCHLPTPFEPMERLRARLGGPSLWCKRDDCTGLALGGNKARQLEFHFGRALRDEADTVLITGAVQSNYVRTAAAAAARFGVTCEVFLEQRVPGVSGAYDRTGNVLLNRLYGATVHLLPPGDDEQAADRALDDRAAHVRDGGRVPYVIHLGPDHEPLGSLGYVLAAWELLDDAKAHGVEVGSVVVASGSAATHAGLLVGLRAAGHPAPVYGICVRRGAAPQAVRVLRTARAVESLLGVHDLVVEDDVAVADRWLGPGYGQLDDQTIEAMRLGARCEALVVDPVYTGKSLAGLVGMVREHALPRDTATVWIHTGGVPALFAYEPALSSVLAPSVRTGGPIAPPLNPDKFRPGWRENGDSGRTLR